ncbi:MAG TPA: hypothetical protein VK789_02490 [Bryobacteraceae bacterium]|jgi:hypothetical protein|nr:hypothetical protein [Bryobacteraceae bacterium]
MKTAAFAFIAMSALAQDKTDALARILEEKGTITTADLARVENAAPQDRTTVLTAILEQKGVLSQSDVARLDTQLAPGSGAAPVRLAEKPRDPAGPAQLAAPEVTTQSRFPVTFYGTLLLNSVYDTAAMNITDIPLFADKQGADSLGNDKTFSMTARQTRLGLRFTDPADIGGARLNGQVEVDFLGGEAPFGNGENMALPRLRLAFGRMDWKSFSLEAGQDWSIFAPLNPTSLAEYAIPALSASGNPWIRMPQIRLEARASIGAGMNLLAQLAAIDPNVGDYNTSVFSATQVPGIGERGRAPGAEARLAFTSKRDDRDFTIGFSGHYTHGKNSGALGDITEQIPVNSWGAAVDFTLPFTKRFNLTGELYTGRELGIFSVTSGEAIQAVGAFGDRGVRSSGGWAQAQFDLARKWQLNVAYGIDDPNVRDIVIGSRTRNQSYMANIMYKYTPNFTIAWEYRRMLTDFRNQVFGNERGDTANLAFAYMF